MSRLIHLRPFADEEEEEEEYISRISKSHSKSRSKSHNPSRSRTTSRLNGLDVFLSDNNFDNRSERYTTSIQRPGELVNMFDELTISTRDSSSHDRVSNKSNRSNTLKTDRDNGDDEIGEEDDDEEEEEEEEEEDEEKGDKREDGDDNEEENKRPASVDSTCIEHIKGRRPTQEDRDAELETEEWSLHAIYDGHGGAQVVDRLSDTKIGLASILVANLERLKRPTIGQPYDEDIMTEICQETLIDYDKKLYDESSRFHTSGSTVALSILSLRTRQLGLVWLGDSRAVLLDSKYNVVKRTYDHKPQPAPEQVDDTLLEDDIQKVKEDARIQRRYKLHDEKKLTEEERANDYIDTKLQEEQNRIETTRIRAAGGWGSPDPPYTAFDGRVQPLVWRNNTQVSMARAIGDMSWKVRDGRYKEGARTSYISKDHIPLGEIADQDYPGRPSDVAVRDHDTGVMSARPSVVWITLEPNSEYILVIACDGLWDVASVRDVAKIIRQHDEEGKSAQVCASLIDYAYQNDSGDNISVIVVRIST